MATLYNKLLISAGGGIISRDQQAEQDECATIAIGLGGTGISCLRALKKEIHTRVKPDADSTIVAKYKHIKFLAVDTDKSSIGDNGSVDALDGNTEFFNISCADIGGLLREAHILQQDASLQWLKTSNTQGDGSGISILSAEAGAGGVRQIGRLLLLRNSKSFVAKLTNMINDARRDLTGNANINIHIFTGLGGGTGAGTFLDVCYIVQHVLQQIGLAGQAYTCGYFFMPDVNLAKNPNVNYIPINGFASMKELDYAMNYSNNGGEWDQQYDGFRVKTSEAPVKLAHLITATTADGSIVSNAYDYAMHVAVDYVLEYIIKPYVASNANTESDGVFSIKSHIANVNRHIEMVDKKHGACYNYCVLGAANAYLPYKEITTYLASKIFEGFGRLDHQLPLDNDIEKFVLSCGLRYEDLLRAINDKVPPVPNNAVDHRELYEQVQGISADQFPQILGQMWRATSAISGKVAENKAAMLDTGVVYADSNGKQLASVSVRVKAALMEIAKQSDKGPYYAGSILHNLNAKDLINKFRGYKVQNDANLSKCQANLELRDSSMQKALNNLQNSGAMRRKHHAEEYVATVRAYITERVKIDLYQEMGSLLNELQNQLDQLYASFFGVFSEVMNNLQETFETNLRTLAEPLAVSNDYAIRLIAIQDIQQSLDNTVAAMRIDDLIHGFINHMLNNPDCWVTQDESKISDAVSSYFLDELRTYCQRTIVDYLQVKFDTTNPAALQKKVYDEIIIPLGDRSSPMFWIDSVYSIADSKSMGYISVPVVSDEIKAAAADYKAGHDDISVRASWSSDRITIFRFNCGIPMFGYKGVDNYKSYYKNRPIVGSHLYEGSVGDARDSRRFIDISPLSCIPEHEYTQEQKEFIAIYQKALDSGIICKVPIGNTVDYKINILDEEVLNQRVAMAQAVINEDNAEKAKALVSQIEANAVVVKSTRVIPNNGVITKADLVVKDHVIGSLTNMELIGAQLALLDKQTSVVNSLKELADKKSMFDKNINGFAMALMTGAIKMDNDYTYSYVCNDAIGFETSVELTNVSTQPFGMKLPIYSAFLCYSALDNEAKNNINQSVMTKLVGNGEEVNNCVLKAKAMVTQERINAMLMVAKLTPDHLENIAAFSKGFAQEVATFAVMRGV